MSEGKQRHAGIHLVHDALVAGGVDPDIHELPDSTRTAVEAAAAVGCEVDAIASSLLFLADGEPVLVMTSGRHRVDTDLLAEALGAAEVGFANAKQVRRTTGQVIGGVAPVGHPSPVPTVIDETLADHPQIWTAAGTPHAVVPMTFQQLRDLTGGRTIRIAHD